MRPGVSVKMTELMILGAGILGALLLLRWLLLRWFGKEAVRLRAEIFRSKDGQWYFRLLARNNEPIAQSEAYTRKQSARDTLRLVPGLEEITEEDGEDEE